MVWWYSGSWFGLLDRGICLLGVVVGWIFLLGRMLFVVELYYVVWIFDYWMVDYLCL